jgi:hypothetical protein
MNFAAFTVTAGAKGRENQREMKTQTEEKVLFERKRK